MKRIKRPLIIVVVALLLFALVITGCTPKTEKSTNTTKEPAKEPTKVEDTNKEETEVEQTSINFMNFSANEGGQITLELMKALFEKENPNIEVNIETFGWDNYPTQLQTRVAGGDAPDSFEVNFDTFLAYSGQEALLPLGDVMTKSPIDLEIMSQSSLDAFSIKGDVLGLPYSYGTVVLVYNKDLFDQAGIAYPSDDWTWAEMDEAAATINALGDDYFGVIQPIQPWEFFKLVQQNGGNLLNDDLTEFTVNTAANVETLQHAVDRGLVSGISPTPEQMGSLDEWGVFKLGKTGMIVTGIWAFPSFTSDCDFNWDISVEPGNLNKATHYFANALCVSSGSENTDAAYEWIKFVTSGEEMALARVKLGWELPCSNYESVLEQYLLVTPPDNKQAVFDSLNYVITQPKIAEFGQMADILGLELSAAAAGAKTAQEALDDAQAALEAAITLD